jgi:hypothetical protein
MAVQITARMQGAKLARTSLEDFARDVPRVGAAQVYEVFTFARKKLKEPGQPISYPVKWDSERQRRAYFATDGFGHGIPYKRTGGYQRAWVIVKNPSQLAKSEGYTLYNRLKQAKYVGGDAAGGSQSRIHKGRWPLALPILSDAARSLPKRVREVIRIRVGQV